MTRRAAALLAMALSAVLLVATGCTGSGAPRTQVVVTTNILGDITRQALGDEVSVSVLMQPGADPHSFGISARQAAQLERADLVVHNGLGLEEGVHHHVRAAADAGVPTLAVAEHLDPIRYTSDESRGQLDPHFWTDPARVAGAVDVVAEHVVEHVSDANAQAVRAHAAGYRNKVEALDQQIAEQFAAIPPQQRKLVTNHHVFGYLAQRYGFEVVGAVVPSGTTMASPSPSDLEALAGTVRSTGVRAVFADSSQPDRLAQVLAEQAGLHVRVIPLFSESLTGPDGGAATYLDMARANATSITDGLAA